MNKKVVITVGGIEKADNNGFPLVRERIKKTKNPFSSRRKSPRKSLLKIMKKTLS